MFFLACYPRLSLLAVTRCSIWPGGGEAEGAKEGKFAESRKLNLHTHTHTQCLKVPRCTLFQILGLLSLTHAIYHPKPLQKTAYLAPCLLPPPSFSFLLKTDA